MFFQNYSRQQGATPANDTSAPGEVRVYRLVNGWFIEILNAFEFTFFLRGGKWCYEQFSTPKRGTSDHRSGNRQNGKIARRYF
jgi:hypothetical protein